MFCNKCGKQIKPGARFCDGCGKPVAQANVTPSAPGTPSAPSAGVTPVAPMTSPAPVNNTMMSQIAVPAVSASNGANISQEMSFFINGRTVRKTYPNSMWQKECPIRITECVIADKDAEGNVALYVQIENLSDTVVEGVFFDVKGFDVLKEEKCSLENIACIDIRVLPGAKLVIPKAIELTDKLIRKVSIIVRHVVFEDETIWNYDGKEYLSAVSYELKNIPEEYAKDMDIMCDEVSENKHSRMRFPYYSINGDGYWVCACGQFNVKDNCIVCKEKKAVIVKNFTEECLKNRKNIRVEKEERELALQRAREAEEKRLAELEAAKRAEEARRQAEEAARAAEEARRQAEAEEARRRAEEEAARRQAEEEAARKAEEAKRQAEMEAARKAEEAKRQAEEAKRQAEIEAAKKAEEEKRRAEESAKRAEEVKRQIDAVKELKNEKPAATVIDDDDDKTMISPKIVPGIVPGAAAPSPEPKASTELAFCTKCGTKRIPGNLFCTGCGQKY